MKTLNRLLIIGVIVFMTCSPALSLIDVQQYLNPDETVNQAAIEAAIADGADPIAFAAELAAARPELAAEFAVAVATAAPNVDIAALMAAVIAAAPDQADRVTNSMLAAFPAAAGPGAGNAFQAGNVNQPLQNQQNQAQQYQSQKHNVPSPSS